MHAQHSFLVAMLLGLCCVVKGADTQRFNFEVSKHVVDVIDKILDVGTWPHRYSSSVFQKKFSSRHDINTTAHMFYFLLNAVPQARHVYASFEDGQFIGVVRGGPGIPALKSTYNLTGEFMYSYRGPGNESDVFRSYYETDNFGLPTDFLRNTSYDGRLRQWYIDAKAANRSIWSGPYIFSSIREAGMTYCIVLHNDTAFDGVLAVDFSLTDISDFLKAQYPPPRQIKIVDSNNLLIGTSTGENLLVQNFTDMVTTESDPALQAILQATPFNNEDALRVVENKYIQTIHYFKNDTGINWLIVVIMPASPSKDFLILGDRETGGIVAVSVLSAIISIVGVILFVRYRDAKIVLISQRPMIAIFLFGCFMINFSFFTLLQPTTMAGCRFAAWWANFWFTFAFAPILIKTWLLFDIFQGNNRKSAMKYSKSWWIGKFLGFPAWVVLVGLQTFFLLGSTIAGEMDPYSVTVVGIDKAYETHTYCGPADSAPWRVAGFVYEGLILTTGFAFAILTRGIHFFLAESWSVVVIVYTITIFVSVIFLVLLITELEVADSLLLRVIALNWSTAFSIIVLLGPRFHKLFTVGDKAAMEFMRRGPLTGATTLASTSKADQDDRSSTQGSPMGSIAAVNEDSTHGVRTP